MTESPIGVIEGFFGPPWSEQSRLDFAPFLQVHDFAFYLYAPKADPCLRKKWRDPWGAAYRAKLARYSKHFRAHDVHFGVGLSPFELHLLSTQERRSKLQEKVSQLEDSGIDLLGLFFDDVPVHDGAAQHQLEAIEIVRACTKAKIICCPSFYSPDPILEKIFGKRPEKYWEEIALAPTEVELAWTGPRVLSEQIPLAHLEETTRLLGRKPFLWDNLFANDGPKNCKFLKLRAPDARTAATLSRSSGWAFNPMSQAALSQIVLLAARHSTRDDAAPDAALTKAIDELCPPNLSTFVQEHRKEMLELGLDGLEASVKDSWAAELRSLAHPVANEIGQWLRGEAAVGPECLTD